MNAFVRAGRHLKLAAAAWGASGNDLSCVPSRGMRSRQLAKVTIEAVTQTTIRAEVVLESPFYIPMTGPAARPRRSLKHDDTFILPSRGSW
jgi:hypothetical protein